MHRTPSPTAAFWLAAFTYFIWGFTFLASRVAQNYGSPFVLLFWRFALAFVLMNLLSRRDMRGRSNHKKKDNSVEAGGQDAKVSVELFADREADAQKGGAR